LHLDPNQLEAGPSVPMARIIGRVGANPDDSIVYTTASDVYDWAPVPPGGSEKSVGLEVVGHSMRWVAEDGSLIYFEDQRNPPAEDMLGYVVIVETIDGQVLVKRLLRGSAPKLFDLESQNGPTLRDQRLRWAADITAILPPKQARKVIRRGEAA
jgi:SOS-response transcriptional repressor LexA